MKKLFKVAIQMDPLDKINIHTDSTYVIAKEAQKRNFKLFHYLPKDLSLENNTVTAEGSYFHITSGVKKKFRLKKKIKVNLNQFDIVLVRQDPPFDMHYITSTYLLEHLSKKVLVLNNPKHIRNYPEKLSMFYFKNLIPKTIVSKNEETLVQFIKKNSFTILKPLYGNGGEGIEKVTKNNIGQAKKIIKKMIKKYFYPIVAQKFISDINKGDRRIILFDGEYMGSVARIPKKGSIKANFHAGGSPKKTGLVFRDKKICSQLKSFLKKNKLFFAGIDVIGNYLTEINVTSPTGIQEINRMNNTCLEKKFWDKVEKKLN